MPEAKNYGVESVRVSFLFIFAIVMSIKHAGFLG